MSIFDIINDNFEFFKIPEYNLLDLLQLLRLHQTVTILHASYEGPFAPREFLKQAEERNGAHNSDLRLLGALEEAMGRENVLTRCKTEHGIILGKIRFFSQIGKQIFKIT